MDKNQNADEAQLEQAALIQAYHTVFRSDPGKLVLRDLAKRSFFNDTTVEREPHLTHYNEGRRAIMLEVLGMLQQTAEEFILAAMDIYTEERHYE